MDYNTLFKESNENIKERFDLVAERIETILTEETVSKEYLEFFRSTASYISYVNKIATEIIEGTFSNDINVLKVINHELFKDILSDNYEKSYGNPEYCESKFSTDLGQLLCFLYTDIRSIATFAFEGRLFEITIYEELFVQIYNCFENTNAPDIKEIKDILYWFNYDYTDVFMENIVNEQYNPDYSFARDIIMNSDLEDLSYLYKYGEYISENEIQIALYLNSQPFEKIKKMADTMTEGYRMGFVLANKDLSKKNYASVHYAIGFERMIREVINNLHDLGLEVLIYRAPIQSINRSRISSNGFYSTSPNRQYDYDHKDDVALYYDNNFAERKLSETEKNYEAQKDIMKLYAGPAVLEVFGESPFMPAEKEANINLNDKQRKTRVNFQSKQRSLLTQYVNYEERSFTIIAFPIPEIGDKFNEIFDEVIKINTLDYNLYSNVQQTIINALDKCDYVKIKGMNGNITDLQVSLCDLNNPEKETKFENCVADVNIPVGEVFTSPKLKGTNGVLNVSKVYLNGLLFKDLEVTFKDGMIEKYSCKNFDDNDKNNKFIIENLLFNRETLPIGEFAIGTNTTAYVMASKYNIEDKLPILIAEKQGPHFAVGDTCYSLSEDIPVFNPDGKEIICRDNEITKEYRKTDMSKAYYNCHTDITIPYRELGLLSGFDKDGNETIIIKDGRFVLEGTNPLNEPFENN